MKTREEILTSLYASGVHPRDQVDDVRDAITAFIIREIAEASVGGGVAAFNAAASRCQLYCSRYQSASRALEHLGSDFQEMARERAKAGT